ncbi:HlyD family secretion protein [Stenotrophomonas maltophilia]|uniref:HlyD family secretion protein n=1 Tax=Stenotrophomonas maltophilia TaxID=40324 RepID=UPI0009B2A3A4|nr:HlyD family efflux transporter periplasmic adaptor subunit [Stenotrophomonas maltophilia]
MSENFFRKEVFEARRNESIGRISVSQPIGVTALSCLALFFAATIICVLLFGSYSRRTTVAGHLSPSRGLSVILAPSTGVLTELLVQEGEQVAAGQRIAVVTVPRATGGDGDTAKAIDDRLRDRRLSLDSESSAEMQQLLRKERALAAQIAAAELEIKVLNGEIVTRREQAAIVGSIVDRMRPLTAEGFVSQLQVDEQIARKLDFAAQVSSLERQRAQNARNLSQLRLGMADVAEQMMAAKAVHSRQIATLDQERIENDARGSLEILAPVSGTVSLQGVKSGQSIQTGQQLLSLISQGDVLEAEFDVPSRAIGFISEGNTVHLRYLAFPYQKFGHHLGTVSRISASASIPDNRQSASNGNDTDTKYRVVVKPNSQTVSVYGRNEPLRAGMLIEADVIGEKRTLGEWLFEPLISVKGALSGS